MDKKYQFQVTIKIVLIRGSEFQVLKPECNLVTDNGFNYDNNETDTRNN